MSDHYITTAEFAALVALGALVPWLVATAIQTHLYLAKRVSKSLIIFSALLTLLCSSILGVLLWSQVSFLTTVWQRLVLGTESAATSMLVFIPVGPMTAGVVIVAVPITLTILRAGKNA